MIHAQDAKGGIILVPVSVASNATSGGTMDTLGFEYLTVDFILDSAANVTDNPATMQLLESDDTVASNFAAIAAFVGDTAFTIPNVSATLGTMVRLNSDLRARKRFIKAEVTASATGAMLMSVTTNLTRPNEMPNTAAEAGVTALVNG